MAKAESDSLNGFPSLNASSAKRLRNRDIRIPRMRGLHISALADVLVMIAPPRKGDASLVREFW
jgi:hypothetical protein